MPTTAAPRVGFEFTHRTLLDLGWQPGPGQKYADAPKAACYVTKVTRTSVYYRYAHTATQAAFVVPVATFARDYLGA